ncbi:flagellar hook-associated protein FlgK [Amphiplicatus metriothermophilus]|uniref:Flagellar hook-associated protein 1 n=1 Tax=Amphiplicatus metriothermophilus TaxID=1519374 RepID=A0A239PLP5_9PROT|nr:flagellar hook-associated protein FlgK [Amphiplicatus metriothermophilus]MBB5517406.1 flagellar hook-associated protein 1 FlgK [Amphiplicatus metriothermophilus]SNT68259.1 flagellar hook-associated protein 1 FlgK [Amphiplicatus metriothermophilus]
MTLSSALTNATSGLAAAQRRADVVSNNIANALTPGYARRDISVSERTVAGRGAGVAVDGETRASDPVLSRDRRAAEGALGRDRAIASARAELNGALGELDDPFNLFSRYQALETALRAFSETPESVAHQAQTLDAAKSLATTLNQLSGKAQALREDADAQIAREVGFVNAALKQVEQLNDDISKAAGSGRDVSALLDQRKKLIDEISAIIPVRELPRDQGKVDLITQEGAFLIAGTAREIQFAQTHTITADLDYAGGAGALSGLSVDGIDITPGGPGGLALAQGSLAGHFAVRDEIVPAFQAQIDGLARDLIERFTDIDATLPAGAPGLFTDAGGPIDPLAEKGLAGRIAVNAAADPDQGGALFRLRDGLGAAAPGPAADSTYARAQLDALVAKRALPPGVGLTGTQSAAEAAAGVATIVGSARIVAETGLAGAQARADAIIDAETAAIGVDTDAELQNLLVIEQAYAANARVIQTIQRLFDTLTEIL